MRESLSVNTNISHYRILSQLGAGGMGEVWLAEDTHLDRKVALKLLPAAFTQDAERVRRFRAQSARSPWIAGNITRRICPSTPRTEDCQRAGSIATRTTW